MPSHAGGELAGTIGPPEPEPRRLGEPARGVGDLAQLAAEADLAAARRRRPAAARSVIALTTARHTPRSAPGSASRTPPTVEA